MEIEGKLSCTALPIGIQVKKESQTRKWRQAKNLGPRVVALIV